MSNAVPQSDAPSHPQRAQDNTGHEAGLNPLGESGFAGSDHGSEATRSGTDRETYAVNPYLNPGETEGLAGGWPHGLTPALCKQDQSPTKRVWW